MGSEHGGATDSDPAAAARIAELEARVRELEHDLASRQEVGLAGFLHTVDQLPIALFGIDGQHEVLWASAGARRMFPAVAEHDIIGRPSSALLPRAHREEVDARIEAALGGERQSYELTVELHRGETSLRLTHVPVRTFTGEPGIISMVEDISAVQQQSDQLADSQRRLALIADHTNELLYLQDEAGDLLYVSPSVERLTGWTAEEYGTGAEDIIVHDSPITDAARAVWTRSRAGDHPELPPYEVEIRHRDGTHRIHEVHEGWVRDDTGEWVLLGVAIDVTSRHQAAAELVAREELYRTLFENVQDVFFRTDRDGVMSEISPSVERWTGFSPAELVGQHADVFYADPDDRARLFSQLQEHGEVLDFETRMVHRDGYALHVSVNARTIHDADGEVVGTDGTLRDISERKRSEAQLQLLATAVRAAPDAVVISDMDGRIVFANPAVERLTGLPRQELLLADVGELLPEVEQDEGATRLLEAMRAGRAWRGLLRREGTSPDSAAETQILDAGLTPVEDADGGTAYTVTVLRDVTERHHLEEQLITSEKMNAIGRVAGGVAHDFNNIITAITGFSELLLAELPEDDRRRRDIIAVRDAGRRAADLTSQLLAFSRRQRMSPQALDLNELLASRQRMLTSVVGESIELDLDLERGLPEVHVDPTQMEQVVLNMVINARDAMAGGGHLRIRTSEIAHDDPALLPTVELEPGDYIRIEFEDTGHGMDEETRQRVFEPFFTTKARGKGTGLGMSTCYGIIKQSSGDLTVHSELGQGTTFTVLLPRATPSERPRHHLDDDLLPTGQETVLLVEDESAVRQMCTRMLEGLGYRVIVAEHGLDALEQLETVGGTGIDLLLSDVVMPVMGGRELAERVREVRPWVPVVFMSGYSNRSLEEEYGDVERLRLMQKPFTREQLAQAVRGALDGVFGDTEEEE